MIYRVICTTITVSEAFIEADSREQAIEIADDGSFMSDQKEEVVDTTYRAIKESKHPKGRIVYTNTGYIDADKKRHRI